MQDNRALQAGTSHNLGQNFAKVFDLKFQNEARASGSHAWNTSWGVSTRLVGALIMVPRRRQRASSLPPRVAPIQVVVVPIWKARRPEGRDPGRGRALVARPAAAAGL